MEQTVKQIIKLNHNGTWSLKNHIIIVLRHGKRCISIGTIGMRNGNVTHCTLKSYCIVIGRHQAQIKSS